jgi:hypothetical protein
VPQPKERTVTVTGFTEGFGLTETGIRVFEDVDWNEQRAGIRRGIISMLVCCEEIQNEKKRYFVSSVFSA